MIWRIFPILLAIVFSLLASAPALAQKLDLTVQEKQWLADHPKIRVGVMAAWAPLSFVTRDGEAQGLAIDYVEAIKRQLMLIPLRDNIISVHYTDRISSIIRQLNGFPRLLIKSTCQPYID